MSGTNRKRWRFATDGTHPIVVAALGLIGITLSGWTFLETLEVDEEPASPNYGLVTPSWRVVSAESTEPLVRDIYYMARREAVVVELCGPQRVLLDIDVPPLVLSA